VITVYDSNGYSFESQSDRRDLIKTDCDRRLSLFGTKIGV
jgi:hypothetical protein